MNETIALGSFQRWGVRTFDQINDIDDISHTKERDDVEEEEKLCVVSSIGGNRTCDNDSPLSNSSATASASTNSTFLSTWIMMMMMVRSSVVGLSYDFTARYKMVQVDLLNSLDSIIAHRKYELGTMQGRPSLIVWFATTLKDLVKAVSIPTSLHLNMPALVHTHASSNSNNAGRREGTRDDEYYYHYQLYTDGAVCDVKPTVRRATIVHFVCGTYNNIMNVTELQVMQCVYDEIRPIDLIICHACSCRSVLHHYHHHPHLSHVD